MGKFVILDRIAHFLDTGETVFPGDQKPKPTSRFDWHSEVLSKDTVITDNYKNAQNVRRFFQEAVDPKFKFSVALMEWMEANVGKTLGDAGVAYSELRTAASADGYRTRIKSHNQFNQYTRDFLDDNPALGMEDVRKIWALKIQLPSDSGRHIYHKSDLTLGKTEQPNPCE